MPGQAQFLDSGKHPRALVTQARSLCIRVMQ
jgi:hypothetical protein